VVNYKLQTTLRHDWARFELTQPAQRKIGFLVQIIAELEERHGAGPLFGLYPGPSPGLMLGLDVLPSLHYMLLSAARPSQTCKGQQ
jgi:hypothetical protein